MSKSGVAPKSSAEKRDEKLQKVETGVKVISDSVIGDGVRAIGGAGEAIVGGVANYVISFSGKSYLEDPNLTVPQKIVPVVTTMAAGVIKIPSTIMSFVGGSFAPPIMICASTANITQDLGLMVSEQSQIGNIEKQLISRAYLQKKIDKAFNKPKEAEKKKQVEIYAFEPKEIYNLLFRLRQTIIKDTELNQDKKTQLIQWVNTLTESMSKQKTIMMTEKDIDPFIKKKYSNLCYPLINHLSQYNNACQAIKDINLCGWTIKPGSTTLESKIKHFKHTQDEIYSQDMPISAKESLEKILTGGKIDDDELKLFFATDGNYRINVKATAEVAVLDDNYRLIVENTIKDEQKRSVVIDYYELPRKMYQILWEMKEDLHAFDFKDEQEKVQRFTDYDTLLNSFRDTSFLNEACLKTISETAKLLGKTTLDFQQTLQRSSDAFEAAIKDLPNVSDFKTQINQHRLTTLQQYAFGIENHFDAPNIVFNDNKNDLIASAEKAFKNSKLGSKITNIVDSGLANLKKAAQKVNEKITVKIRGQAAYDRIQSDKQSKKDLKDDSAKLTEDLNQDQSAVFSLIDRKQHMEALKSIQTERVAQLGLNVASATTSTVGTVTLAAGAIPAGQAALAASIAFASAGVVMNVFNLAISLDISRRLSNQEQAVEVPKQDLLQGLAPDVDRDQKELAAFKKPGLLTQFQNTLRRSPRLKEKANANATIPEEALSPMADKSSSAQPSLRKSARLAAKSISNTAVKNDASPVKASPLKVCA